MLDTGRNLTHITSGERVLSVAIINGHRPLYHQNNQIFPVHMRIEETIRRLASFFRFSKPFILGIRSEFRFIHIHIS